MKLGFLCLGVFAMALSARAETVRKGLIMPGTPYETPYWVKTGAQPGPTVVVIGGCHGDEPAGYLAADKMAHWKITRGTLWILPHAHRQAIARNVRGYPGNMNNMFPGKANGTDMERLACSIWSMIVEAKPDLLFSLHESRDFHAHDKTRYGQTLAYDFDELIPTMQRALDRTNPDIKTPLHKFVHFVKPFPHCPTYNCWTTLHAPATSIETSKTLPLPLRIRYQLMMSMGFFDDWGLGYEEKDIPRLSTATRPPSFTPRPVSAQNTDTTPQTRINTSPPNPPDALEEAPGTPTPQSSFRFTWPLVVLMSGLGALGGWVVFKRRIQS